MGVVDKTFITEGETGERIAKVRICEQRIPTLGDKFASTVGQKGTIGMVIPECDMPFTINGTRPDMIINPHALPSRMTIGQLISSITGKACVLYGGFGDCTAFNQRGTKIHFYGEQLSRATMENSQTTTDELLKSGFHSSGNEILYNGMTGEQIESEIFIGPTYYMRLKHMVKDKINYRAGGPRSNLTRQPVSGRANDGGLRVGEMEKDSILSHGMSAFLKDAMMERGDKYYMAVCNQSGMIAIYNSSKNQFLSPMVDGPLAFTTDLQNQMHLDTISKFGRNFSIVEVPYAFKLLMQELATMNIQLRLITEDNIAQFENMSFGSSLNFKEYSSYIAKKMRNPSANVVPQFNQSSMEEPMLESKDETFPPSLSSFPPASPKFNPADYEDFLQQQETTPIENTNVYSPPYPDNSPAYPYAENTSVESTLYNIGDLVHYRNEKNPNKVYKIQFITPKYITIVNNDDSTIKEDIKILTVEEAKMELYPVVEIMGGNNQTPYNTKIPSSFFGGWRGGEGMEGVWGEGERKEEGNIQYPYGPAMGGVGGGNGNINITPIINVGTMPDYNKNEANGMSSGMSSGNDIVIKPRVMGEEGSLKNQKLNEIKGGNTFVENKNSEENGPMSIIGGLKTVGGLIVKKLGEL